MVMRFFNRSLNILLICCLVACTNHDPARLWFYTHSSANADSDDTLLTPTSFINLQRDGSYTRDFGSFDYGKWTLTDKELVLTTIANVVTKIPVKYADGKALQLITDNNVIANFESQPTSFEANRDDPFSLANSRWRIPATHKETEKEIRKRLSNHCQFWAAYFSWANDNHLDVVDVRSTPTPVKIYGNGFGLKPFEELPSTWRSYFFDVEDCRIANNLLYEVFQYNDISWAHSDNKYKMFIGAFQQLKQHLNKQK
jgi:hypothetical protein